MLLKPANLNLIVDKRFSKKYFLSLFFFFPAFIFSQASNVDSLFSVTVGRCLSKPFQWFIGINITALNEKEANVSLFNAAGQLLISQKVQAGNIKINVKDLPFGLYYMQIKTNNSIVTKKIVKE